MSWLLRIFALIVVMLPSPAQAEPPVAAAPVAAAPSVAGPSGPSAPSAPSVPSGTQAGPVVVTTRLTPESPSVGDLLQYEVTAAFPKGVTVNLPAVLKFDPLHLVGVNDPDPESTGEKLRKVFVIELQHFAVGEAKVPGFPLTYVDAQGQVQTVPVPAYPFAVEALLANEANPERRGEDPPVSPEYPNTVAEIVIYAVFGAIVLAVVLLLILRRIAARERPVYVPPPVPPHELAFGALAKLEREDLLGQGEYIGYYLQLTEIAKGYLEGRFGVEALDQTTDEIRSMLLREPERIKPLAVDDVVAFLERCDLVKFARLQPPTEEATDAATDVRSMVERSTAQPPAKMSKSERVAPDEAPAKAEASEAEASEAEPPSPGAPQ